MVEASFVLRESLQDGSGSPELYSHVGITVSNRYQLEASLGRGGQAVVYRARDLMLMSKPVVVKVLATTGQNAALRKKFQHEVEATVTHRSSQRRGGARYGQPGRTARRSW